MQSKVEERIKANRIFGYIPIRDHFGSHPGRMQWELCGHPLYYWALKAAAEAKHLEKVIMWTEMKSARKTARQLSDKIIVLERTLEECKEPMKITIDDLKTPKSKMWKYSVIRDPKKITDALGFEPTLLVLICANCPLIQAESIDRLIEEYYEDDEADSASLVYKTEPNIWRKNPLLPQYLLPVWQFPGVLNNRQEYEQLYTLGGVKVCVYQGIGKFVWGKMVRVEVPLEEGKDIHDREDLELARFYMEKKTKGKKK